MKTPNDDEYALTPSEVIGDGGWGMGEQKACAEGTGKRGFCATLKAALDRVVGQLRARYEKLLPGRTWLIARTLQEAEREAWATGWPQVVLADIVEHRLSRLVREVAGGPAAQELEPRSQAGEASAGAGDELTWLGGPGTAPALWYGAAGPAASSPYHRRTPRKAAPGFWPPQPRPLVNNARRPGGLARDGFPAYPTEHGQAGPQDPFRPLWLL